MTEARTACSRRRAGFTLLEAIISVAILGTVVVAVLAAFGAHLRTLDQSMRALEATTLAEQRLSVLELLPRDVIERLPDSLSRGRFRAPLDRYEWRGSARAIRAEPGVFELTVRVESEDASADLVTRVHRPALVVSP